MPNIFFKHISHFNILLLFCLSAIVYLESITKGSEFSCMKNCVPPDRKRYVDESYVTGPESRTSASCEKLV